jgi:hypothetical protein
MIFMFMAVFGLGLMVRTFPREEFKKRDYGDVFVWASISTGAMLWFILVLPNLLTRWVGPN